MVVCLCGLDRHEHRANEAAEGLVRSGDLKVLKEQVNLNSDQAGMVMRADCGCRLRKENRQPRYRRRRRAIGVAELDEAELCSVLILQRWEWSIFSRQCRHAHLWDTMGERRNHFS